MNWLTIAVIVFLVIMAGYGAARGLVRMIMSFAAVLLALFIVSIIYEPLEQIVRSQTTIYESIEAGIGKFVGEGAGSIANGTQELLNSLKLPELLKESLLRADTSVNYQSMGVSDAAGYVTTWLTELVFSTLTYVGAFILVRFVLWIVTVILSVIVKLPGLKQLNSFAGVVLSLGMAIVLLWIGCLIVTAGAASPWGQEAMRLIEESTLLSTIYNYNYLLSDILIH